MTEIDNETGEIVEQPSALPMIDNAALATLTRVEIDTQISTARQFPRSVDRAMKNILALATLDEETAEECCYALVRKSKRRGGDGDDNKPIEGPSIRLAEIAAQQWGNNRSAANVVEVNRKEKYVAADGFFIDLETNAATKMTVRRRISTKDGRLFSDDMIVVTGNAACSIAKRNAILAGVPRGVYRKAYHAAREIIAGTVMTLTANREKAISAFAKYGVTPEQLFDALGVEGEGDIKPTHIATLRAMFSTIKNGESTVEEMFGKPGPSHKVVENPLADDASDEKGAPIGRAPEAATSEGAPLPQDAPVAADNSPTGEEAAAGEAGGKPEPDTNASDTAAADNNQTREDAAPADQPDEIFDLGRAAAASGKSRKNSPLDVRKDEAKLARWTSGFDSWGGPRDA